MKLHQLQQHWKRRYLKSLMCLPVFLHTINLSSLLDFINMVDTYIIVGINSAFKLLNFMHRNEVNNYIAKISIGLRFIIQLHTK